MKKYWKEIVITFLQLFMFYGFPLLDGPVNGLEIVVLILLSTVLLSVVLGAVSSQRIKYMYPMAIAVLFVPSVWMFYNESALIHAVWYLKLAAIGLAIGSFGRWIVYRKKGQ